MRRYKSTVTGTNVDHDLFVRCDDARKLVAGELSNRAAADLFDHVRIIRPSFMFVTNGPFRAFRVFRIFRGYPQVSEPRNTRNTRNAPSKRPPYAVRFPLADVGTLC